ncbi:hypothetical protein NECAME_00613 [Necator americanus]|uniref:MSP domain-containing protein n=1 Tax=Necator americanus TaxID=51031 RepID=W2T2J3_NECAM|nr:hypothetical protein NECAME_00613 [Necator americanus]ETN75202.1 hypothetical protein NECAME_00613 [Necator americanus]
MIELLEIGGMDDGDANRLPVFLSVSEIEFPVSERSPRRVITVYNPYGYPIQYKVLCNALGNYSVSNSKGILHPNCCKDLVVKCTTRLSVGTTDCLRVEIMRPGETEVLGSRDLLLRTVSERSPAATDTTSSIMSEHEFRDFASPRRTRSRTRDDNTASSQLACLGVAVICAIALMAPTQGDPAASESLLPHHFHLTVPQKLVAAYILGIVSILLLRPMT